MALPPGNAAAVNFSTVALSARAGTLPRSMPNLTERTPERPHNAVQLENQRLILARPGGAFRRFWLARTGTTMAVDDSATANPMKAAAVRLGAKG